MRLRVRYCIAAPLIFLSVTSAWSENRPTQLPEYAKKCGVRIRWNLEKELRCQVQFNEVKTTEFCSHMSFTEGEYQCIITTKPKLTHDTFGEAVRSCLLQLPEACR
jgi:hypothetical protein